MHLEPSDTRDKLLSDILSYSDVDDEVERVYRAFLDSTLIEYALQYSRTSEQGGAEGGQCRCCPRKKQVEVVEKPYWEAVLRFRQENLNPIPPRQRSGAPSAAWNENADARKRANEDRYRRDRAFLFWFDVRAYYWSKRETSNILGTFEASVQLQLVYDQALALKKRVDAARPLTLSANTIERVRVVTSSIQTHWGRNQTSATSSSSEPSPKS
jgi:hypothetical protein